MPKTTFTAEELANYFDASYKNEYQECAKKLEKNLRVHADGEYPEDIIDTARPNESIEVKDYRKKIWKPKTKPTFNKVLGSLQKIRRSSDWAVKYPNEQASKVPEGESLEDYLTEYYPQYETLEKFMFDVWLRNYLIDANAVCVVFPGEKPVDASEFLKPVAQIFNSDLVLYFKSEDFVVLKNPLGSTYTDDSGNLVAGDSFFIITTEAYLKYDQVDNKRQFNLVDELPHELEYLPAWKLGGMLTKTLNGEMLYESKIEGMLPELDEAVREYSDLQAGVVMNIFPERWEMATAECPECLGTGKVTNTNGQQGFSQCGKCHGVGYQAVSPFAKTLVKPAEIGQQVAIPPVGYIDKPVEIIELQDKRVNKHIFDALAAVNMEFLAEVPLSESGIAKEVDRDETNNFVHSVAEDLVHNMELIIYYITELRYGTQNSDEEVEAMQPKITIPAKFDIFSIKLDEEELTTAKQNKWNPVLINAMEASFAAKKFSNEPIVQKKLLAVLVLDPLANVSEDDKAMRLNNNGITQDDYVLSCNINQFVERAVAEDDKFLEQDPIAQREKLMTYVKEVTTSTSAAEELKRKQDAAAMQQQQEFQQPTVNE